MIDGSVRVAVSLVVEMKKTAEESTVRMFVLMFTPMAVVIVAGFAVSSHQLRPPSLGSFLDTVEISRRRFSFVRSVNRHLLPRKTRVESRQHKKRQKGLSWPRLANSSPAPANRTRAA